MEVDILLSIGVGVAIAAALALYLYLQKEEIEEVFRAKIREIKEKEQNPKGQGIVEQGSDLERQLNSMLSGVAKSVIHSEKMSKITGKKLSPTAKIGKSVILTINNPYNNTNAVKIFFQIVIFSGSGLMASAILANPALGLATMVMGVIIPFALTNLLGLKNKLGIAKGNLHLLSVHLPHYLDSPTLEESLRRSLRSLDPKSMQYKAVQNCLSNMVNLNMTKETALKLLKQELMADKYVTDYINIVLQAEEVSKAYKNILATILKNYSSLVVSNSSVVSNSFYTYILYIFGVVGMVGMVGLLKQSDPESYKLLVSTVGGQSCVLVIFGIVTAAGVGMANAADLITLDITKEKESDPLKEDIYV